MFAGENMNSHTAVFDKNIKVFRRYWSNLEKSVGLNEIKNRCRIYSSRRGDPYLEVELEGEIVLYHSRYDPVAEADRWADSIGQVRKDAAFVFFYGLGLGYHLEEWLRRNPDQRVFVYEPDVDVFRAALESRDLTALLADPRLIGLAIGEEDGVIRELALSVVRTAFRAMEWVIHPVYERRFPDRVRRFVQLVQRTAEMTMGNIATFSNFENKWIYNIFMNLRRVLLSPSIQNSRNQYNGIPAIIVGSGPSLNQDTEVIREITNRCLIIAAGSAVQPLLKAGVRPHLVVSIDGGGPNYNVFKHLDLGDIPLVFAPVVHWKVVDTRRSPLVWIRLNIDTITQFLLPPEPEEPVFLSTASVTGTSIQLACFLGCNPVLLVGQDLSYPNKSIYAQDVNHVDDEARVRIERTIDRQVENVCGGLNPTSLTMLNILRSIEEMVSMFPAVRFINVSRIGARIRGTEWMPLDRWKEEDLRLRPDAPPVVPLMSVVDASEPVRRLPNALKRLQEAESALKDISGILERINGLLVRLKRAEETRNALKASTLALRLEEEWNELIRNPVYCAFYSLPTTLVVDAFLRARPVIAAERDPIARARMWLQYFEPVVRKSEEFTPKLVRNVQALLKHLTTDPERREGIR